MAKLFLYNQARAVKANMIAYFLKWLIQNTEEAAIIVNADLKINSRSYRSMEEIAGNMGPIIFM